MELRINKYVDYEENDYSEDIMRMINHAKSIVEEIENCDDIYDYFDDEILEVRYVIDSNKDLLGGYLTLAWGGPTIILDTHENVLCVYWGGDSVICELNTGTCEEINDFLEMLYTC